jgi:hypothetical protein
MGALSCCKVIAPELERKECMLICTNMGVLLCDESTRSASEYELHREANVTTKHFLNHSPNQKHSNILSSITTPKLPQDGLHLLRQQHPPLQTRSR